MGARKHCVIIYFWVVWHVLSRVFHTLLLTPLHTPTSPFSRLHEQELNKYGEKFLQYMNPDLAAEDRATQGWPYTSLVNEVYFFPSLDLLAFHRQTNNFMPSTLWLAARLHVCHTSTASNMPWHMVRFSHCLENISFSPRISSAFLFSLSPPPPNRRSLLRLLVSTLSSCSSQHCTTSLLLQIDQAMLLRLTLLRRKWSNHSW